MLIILKFQEYTIGFEAFKTTKNRYRKNIQLETQDKDHVTTINYVSVEYRLLCDTARVIT
jgi:hypothetical protein